MDNDGTPPPIAASYGRRRRALVYTGACTHHYAPQSLRNTKNHPREVADCCVFVVVVVVIQENMYLDNQPSDSKNATTININK
jgi:hypothetical protein